MGSLFKAPSPAPAPIIEPTADPADAEREERIASLERRRRGRAGTIVTSERGLLEPANQGGAVQRKTLLGE